MAKRAARVFCAIMITQRVKLLFIWLAIIAAGLMLPAMEVWQDHRLKRWGEQTKAADQQRLANMKLAETGGNVVLAERRRLMRQQRASRVQLGVQVTAGVLLADGMNMDLSSLEPVAPQSTGPMERYRVTLAGPATRAWAEFHNGDWFTITPDFVPAPAPPPLWNVAPLLGALRSWGFVAWILVFFLCIRAGRRMRLNYAQGLTAIALINVLATLGRWRILSFYSLVFGVGPGIWMLLLIISLTLLYLTWNAQRQVDLRACKKCGYDLFGNASGRCPECGTELFFVQRVYLSGLEGESRTTKQAPQQ